MRFHVRIMFSIMAGLLPLVPCGCRKTAAPAPDVAVANSYLHAVVTDLCGEQQNVLELAPPGMCPGHFDMSPAQVEQLCNCRLLFVFDFQKNIESKLTRIQERGLTVCAITPAPGLCLPDTYLSITRQVAAALSEKHPQRKAAIEQRLQDIEKRLDTLSTTIPQHIKDTGWHDGEVVVSCHQQEFARWLGLNPVATFTGRDSATPAQINQTLQDAQNQRIRLVIANQQEGLGLAQSLADRLNVPLAVFSNFPGTNDNREAIADFDTLLRNNIANLPKAAH